MDRIPGYILLFLVVVLLQVFLFNGLNLGIYIFPLVYVAFIILLPIQVPGAVMLLMAFALGAVMDFSMGTPGINTVAIVFSTFSRPLLLTLVMGKDEYKDGGVPTISRMGFSKWIRYVLIFVLIHCAVFFIMESLSWNHFYLTLLRIALSTLATALAVLLIQLLFTLRN